MCSFFLLLRKLFPPVSMFMSFSSMTPHTPRFLESYRMVPTTLQRVVRKSDSLEHLSAVHSFQHHKDGQARDGILTDRAFSIVGFTSRAYGLRSDPFCRGKARSAGRLLGLFLSSTPNVQSVEASVTDCVPNSAKGRFHCMCRRLQVGDE